MSPVAEDLVSFIESGVSIVVGTRDARLMPECTRAMGARVARERTRITLWLPAATATLSLANLRDNGQLAATFSRPWDHRTVQIKGRQRRAGPAKPADQRAVERYRSALADELERVGMPRHLTLRLASWPAHAVEVAIDAIFDQTPGPGAGARRS